MDEAAVEQAALGWYESLDYDIAGGASISPGSESPLRASYESVVLTEKLASALRRINPKLPEEAIDQAMKVATRPPHPTLEQNNRWFQTLLTEGVDVEYRTNDGSTRGDKAWLVDFNSNTAEANNDFLVVNQLTMQHADHVRRPDLVVFLNGLPIAVIELKDPTDEEATIWKAYRQLQDYKEHIPDLFVYNILLAISDGDAARTGSLTAAPDRFSPWRDIVDDSQPGEPSLESLIRGLFVPECLLDYMQNCVVFEQDERTGEIIKKIAAYHQFRAMRKARSSVIRNRKPDGDGRGGVVWHTQGSGKSISMLMLAGALIRESRLKNPTIVVVTDRNDLDDQLFGTFAAGRSLLNQTPVQANSRVDLREKLNSSSGGVVFTTIQKYEQADEPASERSNIIVLADEAHRSQYGFVDGGARWMHDALPGATFVGFTGTPIELDDANTRNVFGDYIDIYDVRQAVDDGATVPIYYESRLVKLLIDDDAVDDVEAEEAKAKQLLEQAEQDDSLGQETEENVRVAIEQIVGSAARIKEVAKQIVDHFDRRRGAIEGKAMAVCISRAACMDLYDAIIALHPYWHSDEDDEGFVKVVMTSGIPPQRKNEKEEDYKKRIDPLIEPIRTHGRTKGRRDALARRFKDPADNLRLVIVCDMWLTGFDCPPMHTMYLDKPLAGHNLMQAISRVNRVFGDKPGGLVVDFLGIADQLRDALQTYAVTVGKERVPIKNIQDEAVPVMQREFEQLANFFESFNYSAFTDGTEPEQLRAVTGGVDYVLDMEKRPDGKRRFMNMVAALSKAFALAVPLPETEPVRDHLAYYQSIRAAIRKRLSVDRIPSSDDQRTAVRQIISGAIVSDGVIDLFQAAGLPEPNVGILSDEFLERIAAMKEKNLALETLRKLLNDQIRTSERTNIVQSRTFREALEATITKYNNRAITTIEVIEELMGLARMMREAEKRGEQTGLSKEELAFYDTLADNKSAKEAMKDDDLRFIARELSDKIKAKATLDWTQRDAVRADMRRTVRRLLTKYGYPPDLQEAATKLVLRQAELMANGITNGL